MKSRDQTRVRSHLLMELGEDERVEATALLQPDSRIEGEPQGTAVPGRPGLSRRSLRAPHAVPIGLPISVSDAQERTSTHCQT